MLAFCLLGTLPLELWLGVRVYRQWRRQVDLSFKDLGLSDATRTPLLVLYEQGGPLRQKDLADALYLDSSSLVRAACRVKATAATTYSSRPRT